MCDRHLADLASMAIYQPAWRAAAVAEDLHTHRTRIYFSYTIVIARVCVYMTNMGVILWYTAC